MTSMSHLCCIYRVFSTPEHTQYTTLHYFETSSLTICLNPLLHDTRASACISYTSYHMHHIIYVRACAWLVRSLSCANAVCVCDALIGGGGVRLPRAHGRNTHTHTYTNAVAMPKTHARTHTRMHTHTHMDLESISSNHPLP